MPRRRRWTERSCDAPGHLELGGWTVIFDAPHTGTLPYVFTEVVDGCGQVHRRLLEPGVDLLVHGDVLRVRRIAEDAVVFRTASTSDVAQVA
ncbi:hypothetical protein [Euzebya sp.]|uniref:hypothetical protein n=1 Tax=Euzebya sp. TaxID=1971409 RepID=UPI003512BC94